MEINGFLKMTLLDFPEKVACTIFCGGCNFCCPFCHNSFLVTEREKAENFAEKEILDFLSKRKGLLDGVCITGGEPLLQPDLEDFIRKIKEMGFLVKLDTNGYLTDKLQHLINEGIIDYVAMDIKNSPQKYALTAGLKEIEIERIKESVDFLINGKIDYEFRTTVANELHDIEDIKEIGKLIKGAKRYFLQNFEDSGHIIGEGLNPVSPENLFKMQQIAAEFVSNSQIRGS